MKHCICQRGWAGSRCQDRAIDDPLLGGGVGGGGGNSSPDKTKDVRTTLATPVESSTRIRPNRDDDDDRDDDKVPNEILCDNKPCDSSDYDKLRKGNCRIAVVVVVVLLLLLLLLFFSVIIST